MRITGGKARGRHLAPFKGLKIRPTPDRVREAVFSIIGQDWTDRHVLDLFAGSGCLGIEALSRGAGSALFIDRSPQSLGLVRVNLDRCGFQSKGRVIKRDLKKGLPMDHPSMSPPFDLVFMDPPYGQGWIPPLLKGVCLNACLRENGLIVAESSRLDDSPDTLPAGLENRLTRVYGDTKIDIYCYMEDE